MLTAVVRSKLTWVVFSLAKSLFFMEIIVTYVHVYKGH